MIVHGVPAVVPEKFRFAPNSVVFPVEEFP